MIYDNNIAVIVGEIVTGFQFSHEVIGEAFYRMEIAVERKSGAYDRVPVVVSDRIVDITKDYRGQMIFIKGQFRSFNRNDGLERRLDLYLFAGDISWENMDINYTDNNRIMLNGFICKPPVYRRTPLGREIVDVLLAVNRPYGKSDYIPCVVWGRNARFAAHLEVGTRIDVQGRIQSREYNKQISETEYEKRIAYEVSLSRIEVVG